LPLNAEDADGNGEDAEGRITDVSASLRVRQR